MSDMTATATKQDIQDMRLEVQGIVDKAVTDLTQVIYDLMVHVDERFNKIEDRLDKLEIRVGKLEAAFKEFRLEMSSRVEQDEDTLAKHNHWIHDIAAKCDYKLCK